ncbi:MAG: hypothetical protein Q7S79_01440 [bacterium]|nr:hypothetical protein [bacterium]
MATRLETLAKACPEISPEEEFNRQKQVALEIAKRLGLSKAIALAQLPTSFPELHPSTEERFKLTVPVIVPKFRGLTWLQVAEATGLQVTSYLREQNAKGELKTWQDPRGVEIPEAPYSALVQDGSLFVNRKPVDVRDELQRVDAAKLVIGGDEWDGLALALHRPDMVESKHWDLIGSQVGTGVVVCLGCWDGMPGFSSHWDDGTGWGSRSLVRGSQVNKA